MSTGNFNLVVLLLEDSVVASQHFYSGVAGRDEDVVEHDYIHKYVLRGNVNGIWGTPFEGKIEGEHYFQDLGEIALNPSWNNDNVHILAYIYDNTTKEILHVQNLHINP